LEPPFSLRAMIEIRWGMVYWTYFITVDL